ncbi:MULTISPECIES: hypothetical protein [unclassified Rathayibacter]|uniref:hypothetical protein n=1 Tax=unclassified Rathayibacter TaxID=2609250 RepID=UPI000CE7BFB8|nr:MULTISPECIES: hypothetical protein [unclassified Rathayibacter]PPG91541.1 hypothetical protein C5C39_06830 [Rathayibacter sp. AY1F3]QHC73775.1 hypothetical protein GSU40_08860 [Rathayibacter sp. VKM Ac-2805]
MADFVIPKDPTNNDIMLILVQMNSTLQAVEKQAIKTNGRVNTIEEWKTGLIAVAQHQRDNPGQPQQINAPNATTVQVMTPTRWFQSKELVGAVALVAAAVATALTVWAGVSQ